MKVLLSLTIVALAWLAPQIAEACSPAYYEAPEVDRGFDPSKSPEPELLDIYSQVVGDGGGCGAVSSCEGLASVHGQIASDVPIVNVAVGEPGADAYVKYGNVYEVEEGIYSFTINGSTAEGLRFYDALGYHSLPRTVDVPSDDTGGCSTSQTRSSRYALFLFAMLLSFGWRRRRLS